MKVDIWHNIMWSAYKATVFSKLYEQSHLRNIKLRIYQIAETRKERVELSSVDYAVHKYPYINIFKGAYEDVPLPRLFGRLANICTKTDADLTILNGYERPEVWLQALILLFRRKKFGFFCDSTIYDNPQTLIKGLAKRFIFGIGGAFFCYGQRSREYLKYYGVRDNLIFTRCQAASLPADYDLNVVRAKRALSVAPPDAPVFLFVGRLAPEKRIESLLDAFAKVLQTFPKARLSVVGRGKLDQKLKLLAETLSIKDNIDFKGSKSGDDLWNEYLKATSLVLPSYSEPWGLVVNEALSFGCPVVVSNRCGCIPELVTDGVTGFSFACGNVNDLTDKMIQVVSYDQQPRITQQCLERISHFTPDHAAKAILDGIEELMQR